MVVQVDEVSARPAPNLLIPILTCAVAGAIVAGIIASSSELAFFVLMAAIVGSMFAAVAMVRFWPFVLVLLAVRPSLDYFQDESLAIDAGGLAAATLLFGAVLWLFAGWRAGTLRPLSTLSKLLLVMIMVQFASVLVAVDPGGALRASLKSASGLLMFVVLEQLFAQDRRRIQGAVVAILVSLVPSFLVVIMNVSAVMDDVGIARHQGTFGHPNALATYCCMTLAVTAALRFTVTGRKRLWLDLATGAQLILIVLTYARGAWLSAVTVLLIVALRYSKSLLVALIGLILILAMAVPSVSDRLSDLGTERVEGQGDPNSLVWRFRYWGDVLPEGLHNPITGIGLEQTGNVMDVELAPHNTFLQAFVETGIVGLGLVIAVIVVVARELRRRRTRPMTAYGGAIFVAATAASVAYLLQMPTENLLNHATLQWPLWVLLAAAFELTRTPEELAAAANVSRRWPDDDLDTEPLTAPPTNELPMADDERAHHGAGTVAVLVDRPSAVVGPAPERHRWWRGEARPVAQASPANSTVIVDEADDTDLVDTDVDEASDRDGGGSLARLLLSSSGTG
ncbi:MAG TPA: O-antigen ligase family protein, partial [Acidimicrobiales bacterium]|nr:O-antigen ligase family protein [Acidimicrobiales bacterium]